MFKVTNSKNRYQLHGRNHVSTEESQAILYNAPVSAFVSYELITSNKEINDSDEYLDFILEPNNEREL